MRINIKNKRKHSEFGPYFLLSADQITGEVISGYGLEEYIDREEKITLDELLTIFEKTYTEELDFMELRESIYDHNCDIALRYKILQLTALKLLYSRNTIPERGYERAKRFINEFNMEVGLNLSTAEIDEIMSRDYKKDVGLQRKPILNKLRSRWSLGDKH